LVGRPRLEPRSLNSGPSGFSIVLRPRVTSWNDLVCLSKGLILPTFLTLETGRTRRFSPDGPPLIRKPITCNNMLLCTFFLQIPSTQEKRSYLLHSWLPVTGGGGGPCCPRPPPTSARSSCRRAVPCAAAVPRGPGRMLTEDRRRTVVLWCPQRSAWSLAHRIGSWEMVAKG